MYMFALFDLQETDISQSSVESQMEVFVSCVHLMRYEIILNVSSLAVFTS